MEPPLVHMGLFYVGLVDIFDRHSYNLSIVGLGRRQWLFCWKVCPKVYCAWLLRIVGGTYRAILLLPSWLLLWASVESNVSSYFLFFLFCKVGAVCDRYLHFNLDLFWGASEKNSVAEARATYTTRHGKLKEKQWGNRSWWTLSSLCDRHKDIYADSFCLWLWFCFSYSSSPLLIFETLKDLNYAHRFFCEKDFARK